LGSFLEFQVKLFAAMFIVHKDRNERATTTNKRPRNSNKKTHKGKEGNLGSELEIHNDVQYPKTEERV